MKEYKKAKPFPHIVIDGFFDDDLLEEVLKEWPEKWVNTFYDKRYEFGKRANSQIGQLGETTQRLLSSLISDNFTDQLYDWTGVKVHGDSKFSGGALHDIEPGGYLEVHVDFSTLRGGTLDRALNLLLYLNHDWEEEWGGCLELWDANEGCVKKIVPEFNRMVICEASDVSWHGHPTPVSAPDNRHRKSIASYYYTTTSGRRRHGTEFLREHRE